MHGAPAVGAGADAEAVTSPDPTEQAPSRNALKAALESARVIDRLPLSPKALGRAAVRLQVHRAKARAARDSPRWRELQAREAPGGFMDWPDSKEQHQIEAELTPDPVWLGGAVRLQKVSAEATVRFAVRVAQRRRRGWSDEDLWNLGHTIRRTVGAQLTVLAEQTNGYPGIEWVESGEVWTQALRHHGEVLTTYRRGSSEEERVADREAVHASLHWVAEHYEHLGW